MKIYSAFLILVYFIAVDRIPKNYQRPKLKAINFDYMYVLNVCILCIKNLRFEIGHCQLLK